MAAHNPDSCAKGATIDDFIRPPELSSAFKNDRAAG
jgi:hypothetical protein